MALRLRSGLRLQTIGTVVRCRRAPRLTSFRAFPELKHKQLVINE